MSSQPGWYPDPSSASQLRYWDGVQWTPHVTAQAGTASSVMMSDAPQTPAGRPAQPASGVQAGAYGQPIVPLTADGVPYATYGSRVGAYLLDGLITTAGWLLVSAPFLGAAYEWFLHVLRSTVAGTIDATDLQRQAWVSLWPIIVISFVVQLVYNVGFLTWKGATPGKLACHINVRRIGTPGPLPWHVALRRQLVWVVVALVNNLVPAVNWLTSLLQVADIAWPLWHPQRRALHDLVAGTIVVMTPRR